MALVAPPLTQPLLNNVIYDFINPVPENTARSIAKGTKPLAEAASIQQVLVMMVVHVCRKIMYTIDVSHKVGLYMFGTLIIRLVY